MNNIRTLSNRYPPSPPCSCRECHAFCIRPGLWTVAEAAHAISVGYGGRMMLEIAPDFSFGVLSPAFRGCEKNLALQEYAANGCGFLTDGLCELHGTSFQPLECRFCHHERKGFGRQCHSDLGNDRNTPPGRTFVDAWCCSYGIWQQYGID